MQTPPITNSKVYRALTPLFALDLENPTIEEVKGLHKKLSIESGGKKPNFWSSRTLLDYFSSLALLSGGVATFLGFSKENNGTKGLGIGVILLSIGTFVYGAFNKIDLNPKSNQNIKSSDSSLNDESIDGLMKTFRNKELEFYKRERACNILHRNLTLSYSHEYDTLLAEIGEFNKSTEELTQDLKKKIKTLSENFKQSLSDKKQFDDNFSEMIGLVNNKKIPTASRSKALATTIDLIKDNWVSINGVSTCVKEVFRSLFNWIEESPEHPPGINISETIALDEVDKISKLIKRNVAFGHDISKYDDFIPELASWLNSSNGNIKAAARSFFYQTKHPLGVQPLMDSLKTYDPIQTTERITRSQYRDLIKDTIERILEESPTIGRQVEVSLKETLFNYLDNDNNDIVMVASRLVDPRDEKVRKKLLDLLDKEDLMLRWEILEVLGDHIGYADISNKITQISNRTTEDPFIKCMAGNIIQNIDRDSTINLLIDSLESKCPEVVNFSAIKLYGTKLTKAIEPLKLAGKAGSTDAMFTLNKMREDGIEVEDLANFLKEELPAHLMKYTGKEFHINHEKIVRIINALTIVESESGVNE